MEELIIVVSFSACVVCICSRIFFRLFVSVGLIIIARTFFLVIKVKFGSRRFLF